MTRKGSFAPAIYVVFLMVPIYWLIVMSFKTNAEIGSGLTLIPQNPTLENYQFIFGDPDWYWGYVNAIIYVLMNVVISIFVAVPAAYAFSRYRFFGDRYLFFGFLAFRMLAPAILLIPFVQIFAQLDLIDTHIAVAIAHCFFNVPIAIWILEGFISSVPRQIDETAKMDGYGRTRFFARILLPQIAPGIAVTAFFCFMFSWVELLLANALTTVHAKPIGGIMSRAGGLLFGNLSLLSAASVLALIPGVILIIFVKNHLARGFSMGQVS
ncbi:MAG: carbohydrate ABC transporter permease [Rhizobiaceae bacterium]|nr:carbohydrate ABC transporter permease [Rhizobiaceae bacterium]